MNRIPWNLQTVGDIPSTNDRAAAEPAWTAIRADSQSHSRGRQNRPWSSQPGGLWVSAVVPLTQHQANASVLPIIAGLSVIRALTDYNLPGLRLRWPNDVMVRDRKLGGILVERFQPDRVVIGIGLNVRNHPEEDDPTLANIAISLDALLAMPPQIPSLTDRILHEIQIAVQELATRGFIPFLQEIDSLWHGQRQVTVLVDDETVHGLFLGIDSEGNPRLQQSDGQVTVCSAAHIWQLTETSF
jgi:BirA family biotin operon repressor/biotin-[acetyl-CoA-carboxylase] ligase